jgi:hypothetical protein
VRNPGTINDIPAASSQATAALKVPAAIELGTPANCRITLFECCHLTAL